MSTTELNNKKASREPGKTLAVRGRRKEILKGEPRASTNPKPIIIGICSLELGSLSN